MPVMFGKTGYAHSYISNVIYLMHTSKADANGVSFLPMLGSDIAIKLKTDDVQRSLSKCINYYWIFFPFSILPVELNAKDSMAQNVAHRS